MVLLAQVRIPGFHLKTGIIRGLSPVSYKIQSVSATLAFTANLDLKPTGGKLSAGRPGFSETRVQVWEFPSGYEQELRPRCSRTICELIQRISFCSVFPIPLSYRKKRHMGSSAIFLLREKVREKPESWWFARYRCNCYIVIQCIKSLSGRFK